MPDETFREDSRIYELAAECEAAGPTADVSQVCREHPELIPRVREVLGAARQVAQARQEFLAPLLEADPQKVGRYQIVELLGRGGMGVVYRATQAGTNRTVALKMVRGNKPANSQELIRFLAEASAIAGVKHPNVISIYDYGDADGLPYLALEYCAGGGLEKRLQVNSVMEPRPAVELVAKLADGVAAAHAAGIVHRDLKPENVLFDETGTPKVTDFGLAKLANSSELTQSGAILGTPAYMSPEQARGDTKFVGPSADVWALGVILYQLVTGQKPFRGDDTWAVLSAVQEGRYTAPHHLVPNLPKDVPVIIAHCLQHEPHLRYPTAAELAIDLHNWLAGRPISVRPAGVIERGVKWVRRNPLQSGLMALVMLATAFLIFALDADRRAANSLAQVAQAESKLATETAERIKAESQAARDGYRMGTQLLIAEGAVSQAVQFTDEAERRGVELTQEMKLERVRALIAISQVHRASVELEKLLQEKLPGALSAKALLQQGDLLIGLDDPQAVRLIQHAQESGQLSRADQEYAKGLLADTTPDAVKQFEATLKLNPRHIGARTFLTFSLFTLGRLEECSRYCQESQLVFPEHPHFFALEALSRGLLSDKPGLEAALKASSLRQAFEGERYTNFALACRLLPMANGELLAGVYGDDSYRDPGANVLNSAFLFRRVQKHLQTGIIKLDGPSTELIRTKLPPSCRAAYETMMRIMIDLIQSQTGSSLPALVVSLDKIDTLGEALRRHPEGFLGMIYGFSLFERAGQFSQQNKDKPDAKDEYRRLVGEAGKASLQASRLPSLVPACREVALDQAIYFCTLAGKPSWSPKFIPKWTQLATEAVRERMKLGKIHPSRFSIYVKAARNNQDWTLARVVLDEWACREKNSVPLLQLQAEIELKAGAYHTALAAAEKGLKLAPSDAALLDYRFQAKRKLGLIEDIPAPRPKP